MRLGSMLQRVEAQQELDQPAICLILRLRIVEMIESLMHILDGTKMTIHYAL
jgi:hypothetical protein